MVPRAGRNVAIAAGVIACAPAAWFATLAIPDEVSEDQRHLADYLFDPPALTTGQRIAVGVAAIALVAAGWFAAHRGSHPLSRGATTVIAPIAIAVAYIGFTYGVTTLPVTGANIGGGILLMGGAIVVPGLLAASVWSALRQRTR